MKPALPRLVIATHNRKKAGEIITILGRRFPSLQLLTLADFEGAPEPEETGTTYAQNAAIKAESAARFTGEWALADDAGLEIDALGGEPGLYSKRFAGEDTPFPVKMQKILDALKGIEGPGRAARFRCCIALSNPAALNATETLEATCEGVISQSASGIGGFGYDPIFFIPELQRTMADLTADEKHRISHRGKVLSQLANVLQARFDLP